MLKKLTLVLLLLFFCKAYSQQAAVSQKKTIFFEKVYLHLDREFYYSGEDIWFKAYLLNGQGNQLMSTSNNLYVELIDPNAQIKDRKVIRLDNGTGSGDFKLGDTILSGTYKVRAYTNWMLNFGYNFVFERDINVISAVNLGTGVTGNGSVLTPRSKMVSSSGKNLINFFPEGGSLIEGVTSVLAFKSEDFAGKGVKAKGAVVLSNGDTVIRFESNGLGFGSFLIKPETGLKYQIKVAFADGEKFSALLPESQPQGFSLHLMQDSLKVTAIISTNEATLNAFRGREIEIKARHTGISYFSKKIALEGLITKITILKISFPEGLAAITLSDDKLRPHCERLFFVDGKRVSDRISISANKASFSPKERITLRLQTTDASSQPVKANLSVAVVDAGIVPENKGNIVSYIHLQSEIRGTIEKPEQYFDPKNPERSKQLDLLLMTQGWRDFVWKRLRDTTLTISHLNETGFTISGQVKDKSGSKPLAGVMVTLFANGAKDQKLFGTSTNQLGKYYFDNINLEGNQTIKLVSSDIKAKKTGTLFLDSLYTKPLPVIQSVASPAEPAKVVAFKSESALRWEERKKLNLSDTIQLNEVAIKAGSKDVNLRSGRVVSFGYPDQNFIITEKDDKDYQSLRHYLLTNVQGASPDTGANNGVVFTAARTISGYSYVHPTFIVDRNEDLFERMDYYELSMKDIERIIVRHMIGNNASIIDSASGMSTSPSMRDVYLIYLTLKPSAFSKKEPSLLNTSVNGYYQQRRFYEPRHVSNQSSSAKDLRTTIHWQPYIITDATGQASVFYYNADPKSKIRVVVEGITEKGVPVAGDWLYEVK